MSEIALGGDVAKKIMFDGDVAKMFVLATLASKGTPLVVRAFILAASELGYVLTPTDFEPVLSDLESSGWIRRDRGLRLSGAFPTSVETWKLV